MIVRKRKAARCVEFTRKVSARRLYDAEGPRLAPLYDLLATIAFPELSSKFAMKIGKRATLPELDGRSWSAFAADTELGWPLIRRRVTEICESVETSALRWRNPAIGIVSCDYGIAVKSAARTRQDDGPGLAHTDNLWVPFFTTKPGGVGIGLVLSRM